MKYVITGGRGVIGSLITRSKLAHGNHVIVVDDGADPRHEANAETTHGAGLDQLRLGIGSDGIEIDPRTNRILHAAASTGIPYSATAPLDDWSRNVDGTIELLDALTDRPVPTVILSSVKPYSTANLFALERDDHYNLSGLGIDESALLEPDEPYAASKAAQSLVAQAYARSFDLPLVTFRCSNLYGPACPKGPAHGWVTWLCIQAALGQTIEIQGSGKQTRDMLFWSDVERAADLAWAALEAGVVEKGKIMNIGGGSSNLISVLQLVALLRDLGAKFDWRSAPGRAREDMLFCTNYGEAERTLGWRPMVAVRDGVAEIYEWACKNRDVLRAVYE